MRSSSVKREAAVFTKEAVFLRVFLIQLATTLSAPSRLIIAVGTDV
jgi:hypothetical protein